MSQLVISYQLISSDPQRLADAIRVEQSIEFPNELAQDWIQKDVVGSIVNMGATLDGVTNVEIAYNPDNTGYELPQLLNVLWGNVSILPGVRITAVDFPDSILSKFKGPRFGVEGLRKMFDAPTRPLASTALKPMGSSSKQYAQMAYEIARAGFDTIKDDHSLANQPWSLWRERVELISEAVRRANAETGGKCVYAPSLNLPSDQIAQAALEAKALGAGALLILPGISGFDLMRSLAEDDQIGLPIMGHPALLGSFVTSREQGISHGVLFGQLMRLAGADIGIFPNFGGRFSFSKSECKDIAETGRRELAHLKPLWPSPAGGMTLDRIGEMVDFYGKDTASLIGGALHRGDLYENSLAMVQKIRSLS